MSGFATSGCRANAPKEFFFTPYNSTQFTATKSLKQSPLAYSPIYTRTRARTKYDVRNTYPADHVLRRPYRVQKPSTLVPSTQSYLWGKSGDSSSKSHCPEWPRESSQERPIAPDPAPADPGFLPADCVLEKEKKEQALEEEKTRDMIAQNGLEALKQRRTLRPIARMLLDLGAAAISVAVQHGSNTCHCTPEEMLWRTHGIEGTGLFTFVLKGPGDVACAKCNKVH